MIDITLPIGQSMVMMRLGPFNFSIPTATYQELSRSTEFLWPGQQRFGQHKSLQFVGSGTDTMTLNGVIYPGFRGGFEQVNRMRAMAGSGEPMKLIDGNGQIMGDWAITSVTEKQSTFAAFGAPRKMEFTLTLEFFPQDTIAELLASTAATAVGASATAATKAATTETGFLASVKSTASNIVSTVASQASAAISAINSGISTVQQAANDVAQVVGPVIGAATQAVGAATDLYNQASAVRDSLKNINSVAGVTSAMTGLMGAASSASRAGSAASVLARKVSIDLSSTGNSAASSAVMGCAAECGKMAVNATQTYTKANGVVSSIRAFGK